MRTVLGPEDVADVAVAVQADRLVLDAEAALDAGEGLLRHRLPRIEEIGGNEVAGEQNCTSVVTERFRRERFAMLELLRRANRVDAADEAPDPFERLRVIELRRAPAAPRIDGDAEILEAKRMRRCHHRDLALGELVGEGVLLVDLRIAPAPWAVELRHDCAVVLEPDLVDAVLVTVQAQEPSIRSEIRRRHGVEHEIRREAGIWMEVHG